MIGCKKTIRTAALLCAVLLMFSLVSCSKKSSAAGPAEKQKITLRIGSGHATSNPWVAVLDNFFVPEVAKRVAERTNYEIEWIKAYGASVIKLNDELEGIEAGLVDIGTTIIVFEPAKLMLQSMVYRMPFSCADPAVVTKVMKQIYKEFPEHVTEFEKYNQKLLGMGVCDPYSLYTNKEVHGLADLRGMKIGAAGANLNWINGSGAVPVNTSLNEVYQSLQTNVIQGTIQPTDSCYNLKVPEVAPYLLEANFNVLPFNSITINLDKFKSLPKEVQDILVEVGQEYETVESQYIVDIYARDVEKMKSEGVKVYTLPREEQVKWAAALPDIVNTLVTELNERGYKGTAIVSRYYELLEQNGWPRVRDWKIN
ncbi:C4-dicarboxylate TRAP transporter substrate-binding protein [Treponema primitia]|uniref:C4-dicarboxylate TRAP transporter substrate-binding protein n=1 Tax=Treponema primitia TaxID=88058 RepID=UPI0039802130